MPFMKKLLLIFSYVLIRVIAKADESSTESIHSRTDTSSGGAICENRVSAFFVLDNTRPVSISSLTYEDVSEDDCLKMCSENRDNKGRSILCASFTYDHAFFTCTIYRSKSLPDGDLETEAAVGKRFFEKFCIDEELPVECADSQFLRVDQSVIIGYAKNVSIVESLEECATQCLKEHFPCKSAMYFYEEGECITNTESALTKPSSFAREESDKVIYFHSGCNIVLERQKLLDTATETAESKPKKKKTAAKKAKKNRRTTIASNPTKITETTIESSEATTQPQDTTTDAVDSATTIEADRVISDGESHRNAEEGTPAVTSKIDEDTLDKKDEKQGKEDAEKSNERELSREKTKKLRERKIKMIGREKQLLRIESTTEVSEVTALDEVDVDSEEEQQENRKKESKGKKEESEDNGDKKMHAAGGKKQKSQEEKQESGKKKVKSSSKSGSCSQDDESLNEDASETKEAKEYNNHPRALSTTDDENKKDTHKKSKNSTIKRRPHSNRKTHKKLAKIVQVDPATLSAEQRREEVGENEVKLQRKAKARGVAQKSSRKLKIKSLAQADEENGYFSQWSEWTPCLSSGERKVRRRKCLDLRKCVGALMEVDKCPENISKQRENHSQVKTIVSAGPVGPEISTSSRTRNGIDSGLPPSIMPSHLPAKKSGSRSTAIRNASDDIWSPWLGICQEFASGQPCKNNEVIGFESRECIAKDPTKCIGPFFRYCTLPC